MVADFIVRVAMLRTDDTAQPRIASVRAIRRGLDPMLEAFHNIPAAIADGPDRTGRDATARDTSGAWIETERVSRLIKHLVHQQGGAQGDPGSVDGMDEYA